MADKTEWGRTGVCWCLTRTGVCWCLTYLHTHTHIHPPPEAPRVPPGPLPRGTINRPRLAHPEWWLLPQGQLVCSPKPPSGLSPGWHPGLTQFLPRGRRRRKEGGCVQMGTVASAPSPSQSQWAGGLRGLLSTASPPGKWAEWLATGHCPPSLPHSSCGTSTLLPRAGLHPPKN